MNCNNRLYTYLCYLLAVFAILIITSPTVLASDDFGNTQQAAHKITFTETLEGQLDGSDDIDYFRFPARRAYGYIVTIVVDDVLTLDYERPPTPEDKSTSIYWKDIKQYTAGKTRQYTYWNTYGETDLFIRVATSYPQTVTYTISVEESRDQQPEPRADSALAYLPTIERAVLFGGAIRTAHYGDTWLWDGERWKLLDIKGPGERARHAMAAHEAHGEIVLFGGKTGTVDQLGDTWTFSGKRWRKRKTSVSPEPREGHAMTYDAKREVVVLYGGYRRVGETDNIEVYFDDIWEWNGRRWRMVVENTQLGGCSEHIMVWDARRKRVLVFGGQNAQQPYLENLWTWDGKQIALLNNQLPSVPEPLFSHAAFSVKHGKSVIIFSGETDDEHSKNVPGNFTKTTWIFGKNKDGWNSYRHGRNPSGSGMAATYDPIRRQGVVFGGWNNGFLSNSTFIWIFDKDVGRWVWREETRH